MTSRMKRAEADPFTDLAGLLARSYLRLAERSRNSAVSDSDFRQKELEVPAPESPHAVDVTNNGGPPWRAA